VTRLIELTRGHVALVDDEDYEALNRWNWMFVPRRSRAGGGYAYRQRREGGKQVNILMHRVVIGAPDGVPVDHKNNIGLDNRRANLRLTTPALNPRNSAPRSRTGYRGVSFFRGRWRARITGAGLFVYLGSYLTVEEAARAVDDGLRKRFGDFAYLNFPDQQPAPDAVREPEHA
jgi:hypothetical protein